MKTAENKKKSAKHLYVVPKPKVKPGGKDEKNGPKKVTFVQEAASSSRSRDSDDGDTGRDQVIRSTITTYSDQLLPVACEVQLGSGYATYTDEQSLVPRPLDFGVGVAVTFVLNFS